MNKLKSDFDKIISKFTPEEIEKAEEGCKKVSNYSLFELYEHYNMFGKSETIDKSFEDSFIPLYISIS